MSGLSGTCRNPAHSGYCSKCYRDMCAREQRAGKDESGAENKSGKKPVVVTSERHPPSSPFRVDPAATTLPARQPASSTPAAACAGVSVAIPAGVVASSSPARGASKKKCGVCSKKVGLTGFSCKCGSVFCGLHRYAEAHGCEFDHKTSERARLAEDNPLVQASKLDRL